MQLSSDRARSENFRASCPGEQMSEASFMYHSHSRHGYRGSVRGDWNKQTDRHPAFKGLGLLAVLGQDLKVGQQPCRWAGHSGEGHPECRVASKAVV